MINRYDEMMKKNALMDYSKLKLGDKFYEDISIEEGFLRKVHPTYTDKEYIYRALYRKDYATLREISSFFYETNGIYQRLCDYMAFLYKYDWMVVPYVNDESVPSKKILTAFNKALTFLDDFDVKNTLGQIALDVLVKGCYYCVILRNADGSVNLQELPPNYCRSRFKQRGKDVVELNLRYFDAAFTNPKTRAAIINMFPKEVGRAYLKLKEGTLPPVLPGETAGWVVLDPAITFKFSINHHDSPMFASVIPSIIDLDDAQAIDRKRMARNLVKVIAQLMPFDKNGDPIFDQDEVQAMHQNAVRMLGGALGLNVLTTFADVKVLDTSDNTTTTTTDELEKVERTVYNNSGVSQTVFNSDSNIGLSSSILTDESSITSLIYQFETFLNFLVEPFGIGKRVTMKVQLLHTTAYNYKEMAEAYKSQTQLGYSKFLPAIALGQSQSSILASAYFETNVLNINMILIPPLNTNTMNGEDLLALQQQTGLETKKVGRPEKSDTEKSDKTIQNRESLGEG